MFRDPTFYVAFREKVVPLLRTYPFTRDLVRRLLDRRGGLLARDPARGGGPVRPHADLRDRHQRGRARDGARGRLPARARCRSTRRTTSAPAASATFSEYYVAALRRRALLALAARERRLRPAQPRRSDRSFNEFNVILCRNVMIYFDQRAAGPRARLFYESLEHVRDPRARPQGVDLASPPFAGRYEELDADERIYRKIAMRCTTSS